MKLTWIKTKQTRLGQVALEYALTTAVLALIAALLYIIYQPLVYHVFSPLAAVEPSTGTLRPSPGIGTKQILYLPLP